MRRCSSVCSIKSLVSFTFDFSTSAGLLHGRLPVGFIIRKVLFADVVLHMSCYVNQMNEVCFAGSGIRFYDRVVTVTICSDVYDVAKLCQSSSECKIQSDSEIFRWCALRATERLCVQFWGVTVDRGQDSDVGFPAQAGSQVQCGNAGTLPMLGLTNLQDLTGTQPGILGRCSRYPRLWLKWRRR